MGSCEKSTVSRKGGRMDKRNFRAEVKKQLYLRNWSYADLAEHTRYTRGTIRIMMHDDSRLSKRGMGEIARALNIELEQ